MTSVDFGNWKKNISFFKDGDVRSFVSFKFLVRQFQ